MFIAFAVAIGVAAIGLRLAWAGHLICVVAGEHSALASMIACADLQQPQIPVEDPGGTFSDAEYRALMTVMCTCSLDQGRGYWTNDGDFVDRWGKRYGVKSRVGADGHVAFEMWSQSIDCRVGTFQ